MTTLTIKSDKEIKQDVLKELDWDPQVDAVEIGVQVREGIVTLSGKIGSLAKKLAAKRAAHRVGGVLDVVNDLTVELELPHQKTDQEIAKAVRHALEWDVLVPDKKIHSTVMHGHVTLEGQVEFWADKVAAETAIVQLSGVKSVDNRIEIRPRMKIDGTTIRKDIEAALTRQAHREAQHIGVSVKDGTVTLTGTARSPAERRAINRVATFTPGVSWVDDFIRVEPDTDIQC